MATIDKDKVEDFKPDESKVLIDDDVLLEALIENFNKSWTDNMVTDVLRGIRRANSIRTTDLVGSDNMIGARVSYVDSDGDAHRAIVLEPEVAGFGQECYDPQRDEMVDPSTYPIGTCQLIYADSENGDFGVGDYLFDRLESDHPNRGLKVATSVTPAAKPNSTYCYYAGWDYVDSQRESEE